MVARRTAPARPALGRRLVPAIAGVAVVALLGTLAVFAEGYDSKGIPPLETSVWVTRDAGQYARVNTDLAEIDTVRTVADPVGVAQSGADAVVFSSGYRQLWTVNSSNPIDLVSDASAAQPTEESNADGANDDGANDEGDGDDAVDSKVAQNTPAGTRDVLSAGNYLLYLTDSGSVFVSTLTTDTGQPPTAFPVNPFAGIDVKPGEERPVYSATAVALSPEGRIVLYSASEKSVRIFDAPTSQFMGEPAVVQNAPKADARLQIAVVGEAWALSSAGDGEVWLPGKASPVKTGLSGTAQLQSWTNDARTIHLADQKSLVSVDIDSGDVKAIAEGNGVPAAPIEVGGVVYAAWLSTDSGSLWSSQTKRITQLDVEEAELDDVQVIVPRFYGNGSRAVLAEQSTGLLWNAVDGRAIPLDQWTLGDDDHEVGTAEVDDLPQQEPPVAVADNFGVRTGRLVPLPLLLNDHDPNKKDVLSIAPDSMSAGLSDPAFGTLGLVGNDQTAIVQVNAPSGSTTFTYTATDGKAQSAPATVTLTVIPDSVNTAPEWCPVDGCVQQWPTPKISAGGTAVVPVMDGWVDAEGDPIVLTDVYKVDQNSPLAVVPMADGTVAIRHNDPNASAVAIKLMVVVSDSRGAVTEKELDITVGASPAIKASPVAVIASVDQKVTVKISDHVSGGSGAYRVLDAVQSSSTDGGLIVAPNAAGGTVDVSASEPGEYTVTYSVQDAVTLSEQSSIIRLTVVPAGRPLTMAPLTAFVRANEDTTVDVLSAVQNTTGRVLLVSSATSSSPGLNVSVVAQSRLRVSGTTADGEPGLIGTAHITINDGGGGVVQGEVSVFLVPSAYGVGPIAVPDSATVRAGTQVDIAVLLNDLSPRGERLVVHPVVQGSGTAGELAFASESNIRYLAPTVPGIYTINYSVYLEGRPDRVDSAGVTITVIAAGANRPPEPPLLKARTNAGQTVLVPVSSYGMDPDGDRVSLTEVELPEAGQGVPSISPDGSAIVYAAPAAGVQGGQVSFEYTVRDSNGATAVGTVRIGVISAELLDTTPVTFSDYVQVLQGSSTPVKIQPLLNDRDPAQGLLEIISIRPNAPGDSSNPEYARLEALIDSATSLENGEIVLRAGDTLGTHSFVYTVQSTVSTSTAEGLIVVGVAESVAPDMPIVKDTVLTAKDRNNLTSGVDVVSGKVQWASGDISTLKLSIWGSAADRYQVSGSRISGELPSRGDLVPFTLSGKDSSGAEITSHGFLRIPSFDDLRVQLKPNADHIEVGEEKSVDFDISKLLDVDKSDVIEVKSDSGFVVQRANSSCQFVSGTTGRYKSGREAPWTDTCAVSVRIKGQKQWSTVAIPVWIMPKDPQAILSTISRTLIPGETTTIDLYDSITSWEGDRVGDQKLLDYTQSFTGSAFVVVLSGKKLTIEVRADAVPGTRETSSVSVSNFGGLTGGVTLVVGISPPDSPRGATLSQTCDVSKSASCAIKVVGVAGEYDPFEGKLGGGLKVIGIGGGTSVTCPAANVAMSGQSQVVATWPAGPRPIGGECVVPIKVADAQGRAGDGQLTIDVLGYPEIPASVVTSSYSGTTVTVTVPLGNAAQAHPAVTGVTLYEGSSRAPNSSCVPSSPGAYACTVTGLVNGAPHTYSARAANSVGESLDTSTVQTWAYAKPTVTALTAESVYDPARTSLTRGAIDLSMSAGTDVMSFRVVNVGSEFIRTGPVTTAQISLEPRGYTIVVVPISEFQPPIGGTGSNGEGDQTTVSATAIGTPSYSDNGVAVGTETSVTLNGTVFNANGGTKVSEKFVAWVKGTAVPVCSVAAGVVEISSGTQSSSRVVPADPDKEYWVKACGTNGYGLAESDPREAETYILPGAPTGDLTYTVSAVPSHPAPNIFKYGAVTGPVVDARAHWTTKYEIDGSTTTNFVISDGTNPSTIRVKYCRGFRCSSSAPIVASASSLPTTVTLRFPVAGISQTAAVNGVGFEVSCGSSCATLDTPVLDGAGNVTYTVTFKNDYGALLGAVTYTTTYVVDPPPDPDPDPVPDP